MCIRDRDEGAEKMKITTIYAAKILGYITQRDRLVTAGEIVEHVGISYQ